MPSLTRCSLAAVASLAAATVAVQAAPAPPGVRLVSLPGMHVRIAIPSHWPWRIHYQLRDFTPVGARVTLQGLFTTVTMSRTRNFRRDYAAFTLVFVQDPQGLSLERYANAYLGGAPQYHLTPTSRRFGNAVEVYRARGTPQAGSQSFFMRYDGHVYWLAWQRPHTFAPWQIAPDFPYWVFTR